MSVQIGDNAPDLTLAFSGKEKVSLVDYQEKNVVPLFFPTAFTGGDY